MAKQSDVEWAFDDICIRQRTRPSPRAHNQQMQRMSEKEEGKHEKKNINEERIDNKLILADHMR